jgi:hypothetical protein
MSFSRPLAGFVSAAAPASPPVRSVSIGENPLKREQVEGLRLTVQSLLFFHPALILSNSLGTGLRSFTAIQGVSQCA